MTSHPYRLGASAPEFSVDHFRRLQETCAAPDVVCLLESLGSSRHELHVHFNVACALVEALGDALEDNWNDFPNVGRCSRCDARRWSEVPEASGKPKGTRECRACGHSWVPMKFDRPGMISGRLRHYLNPQAHHVEEES